MNVDVLSDQEGGTQSTDPTTQGHTASYPPIGLYKREAQLQ